MSKESGSERGSAEDKGDGRVSVGSETRLPRIFRVMQPDPHDEAHPLVAPTSWGLGVRVFPDPRPDVTPDSNGDVEPSGQGMSVAPRVVDLPDFLLPKRLRHLYPSARGKNNEHKVFRLGDGLFARAAISAELQLTPDRPSHGVVEPRRRMPIATFQQALASTRSLWLVDEGAEK